VYERARDAFEKRRAGMRLSTLRPYLQTLASQIARAAEE
jgi:hypothetical protein